MERWEWGMKVGDFLRIPYVLEASSVESADGTWMRKAEYVELEDCWAEAGTIIEAVEAVDRRRVYVILEALATGQTVPAPRSPVPGLDLTASQVLNGSGTDAARFLDLSASQLRERVASGEIVLPFRGGA